MPFDPQESRKAHTETSRLVCVAASSPSPSASSPAPALRDSQPASCRGDGAGQPFPLGAMVGTPLRPRRHVPPIPADMLRRIYDEDRALNRRHAAEASTWTEIAVCSIAAVALVLFVFFLDGGWIVR